MGAAGASSRPRLLGAISVGLVPASQTTRHPMSSKHGWRTAKNGASARKDTVGDAMTEERTCTICGKAVAPERIAQYPSAVVCGKRKCRAEHTRVRLNRNRKNYRHRRLASDPAFVLLEKQKARERYVVARLRLGKTPALREPIPTERGPLDTFLAGIRMDALTAFLAPITWVRGLMGRRRERKIYEALRIILTRQRDMQR